MPKPQALSASQRQLLISHIQSGADLPSLQAHAKQLEITAGRTVLAELLKATRAGGAAPAPAAPAEPLAAEPLAVLTQKVADLTARLARLETSGVPRLSLLEAATQAVQVATMRSQDPLVDPNAQAKFLSLVPDLIDSTRRVREAEEDEAEDSGLFSA